MKPKHYLLLFVLLLAAAFAGRSWPVASLAPVTAEAQERGQDDEGDDRKWEYCAVTKAQFVGSIRGGQYWISYFRRGNVQVETIEASVHESAVAKAVFKLGEEGWEMVGEGPLEVRQGGPGGTPTALYFKRRKSS